jgi:hypothetical protein
MMVLKIIPDRRLTNDRVEAFAAALHALGKTAIERTRREGLKLVVEPQQYAVWEWHLGKGEASAYLAVPTDAADAVTQQVHSCWPRATVETVEQDPFDMWSSDVSGANVTLREHYVYGLSVDRRSLAPLGALFESLRMLHDDEHAVVQIHLMPAPKDWHIGAQEAYERIRKGHKPTRIRFTGRAIAEGAAKMGASIALHANALVAEVIAGHEIEPEPLEMPSSLTGDTRLPRSIQKSKYPAFDVSIRLAVSSSDALRRQTILHSIGMALRELDGDNALVMQRVQRMDKWWSNVRNRREPGLKVNADYLSIPEVSRLLQMPTASLQDEYDIAANRHREMDVPESLLESGILLGTSTFRGESVPVYMPTDNWDDLCLPRVVIGGMGTGKTKGFGGNWGAQAVAQGFSVISIDVAKDELGDEIRTGCKKLDIPREKLLQLQFGRHAYRLDWREAEGMRNAANRLAGEAVNFFRLHGAEAGIETGRYIRLAGKTVGVIKGSLSDMMKLFTDDTYRHEAMEEIRESRPDLADEWQTFDALSPGMKGKVMDPVLNRLDMLLGDDYLRECMETTNGLDFRKWLTGGYHISIHVPKAELGPEAVDILVDFLMSKIELAMLARPEEQQIPCFVIADEPHQFGSCAPRWERMAVESRKWRLGLVWMFHSFEQIPRSLAHRIKDAGCHYHLYTSSKRTYAELAEEIAPFTFEEAIKTPKHAAINVLRSGTEAITPFMLAMAAPPTMW